MVALQHAVVALVLLSVIFYLLSDSMETFVGGGDNTWCSSNCEKAYTARLVCVDGTTDSVVQSSLCGGATIHTDISMSVGDGVCGSCVRDENEMVTLYLHPEDFYDTVPPNNISIRFDLFRNAAEDKSRSRSKFTLYGKENYMIGKDEVRAGHKTLGYMFDITDISKNKTDDLFVNLITFIGKKRVKLSVKSLYVPVFQGDVDKITLYLQSNNKTYSTEPTNSQRFDIFRHQMKSDYRKVFTNFLSENYIFPDHLSVPRDHKIMGYLPKDDDKYADADYIYVNVITSDASEIKTAYQRVIQSRS